MPPLDCHRPTCPSTLRIPTREQEGGFALITGPPGTGKSVALRRLAARLEPLPDLTVAALAHPSANLADFYRELGDLFAVDLKPHNRWMGFKALRARWLAHLDATLLRPVMLIDEAQELHRALLNELRLLASSQFDSRTLLSVVLCGDQRLTELLRRDDLLPLGSRIRLRLTLHRRFSASSDITAPSATGHPVSVTTPSTESFRGLEKGATRHLALGRFFLDHYCLGPFQDTPRSDTDTLPDNPGLGESRLSRDNLDHANI